MLAVISMVYVADDIFFEPNQTEQLVEAMTQQRVIQETWIGDGTVAVLHESQETTLYHCLQVQQETYLEPIRDNTFSTQWRFTHCRIIQ